MSDDVKTLSGKALADKARELNIPGRSKMKADELRAAIAEALGTPAPKKTNSVSGKGKPSAFAGDGYGNVKPVVMTGEEIAASADDDDDESEVWTTVPNRRDRRRNRRRIRSLVRQTSDAERLSRFAASVRAGQQGKFYGNRNPNAHRVLDPSEG